MHTIESKSKLFKLENDYVAFWNGWNIDFQMLSQCYKMRRDELQVSVGSTRA